MLNRLNELIGTVFAIDQEKVVVGRRRCGMVGAVVIAHSGIGKELMATTEYLVGKIEGMVAVSIESETNAFEARKTISEAIKRVDQGDGVLLMADLFGGSPSNIAFSFLNNEKVEVVTGVNLPMILTFCNKRGNATLQEIAKYVQLSGTRGIVRARDLMEAKGAVGRRTHTRAENFRNNSTKRILGG